jgi:Cu/Ag efflux pump CusA
MVGFTLAGSTSGAYSHLDCRHAMMDLALQRVTLGSLIIALGLLVDDAIRCVEMIVEKLEQGWMLTGTLGHRRRLHADRAR